MAKNSFLRQEFEMQTNRIHLLKDSDRVSLRFYTLECISCFICIVWSLRQLLIVCFSQVSMAT